MRTFALLAVIVLFALVFVAITNADGVELPEKNACVPCGGRCDHWTKFRRICQTKIYSSGGAAIGTFSKSENGTDFCCSFRETEKVHYKFGWRQATNACAEATAHNLAWKLCAVIGDTPSNCTTVASGKDKWFCWASAE
jgi:hypothetical protein